MRRAGILLAVLPLLASCKQPVTHRPQVSPEEIRAEQAIQEQMSKQVSAQGGTKKAWKTRPGMAKQFTRVAERIEAAGADVCRELGIPAQGRSCYYHFKTSRKDELNAYADGEKVVVNNGLLRFLQSDDEIAAVLAHELSHNFMGHVDAAKQNAIVGGIFGLALDAAVATQGVNTNGGFTETGMNMGILRYSVPFELEADYVGLYIMARAGYDISKSAYIWRRFALEEPDSIYSSMTHPTTAERFVALNKTVDEIKQKKTRRLPLTPTLQKQVMN